MKMHNGSGNGQGFIFKDEGGLSLTDQGTVLTAVCKAPKGIEDIPTKWNLKDRLHVTEMIEKIQVPVYRGVSKLRPLAYLRKDYKGKNENGGRKCRMTTPASYKNGPALLSFTYQGADVYRPTPNRDPRVIADADTANMDELQVASDILDSLLS
jgi:hypothetical protein